MEDMLPNDGSTFHMFDKTDEQKAEERRTQSEAESSYPVLNDLISILEIEIDSADSIRAMGITASMSKDERDMRILSRAEYANLCEGLLNQVKEMKEAVDKKK